MGKAMPKTAFEAVKGDGLEYLPKRYLIEEVVIALAQLYRMHHPKKQWPTQNSGPLDPEHVQSLLNIPDWGEESWGAIDKAGKEGRRGLTRSLPEMLRAHGCHYDLSEEAVLMMAKLTFLRYPSKGWVSINTHGSDVIDQDIVNLVMGDEDWQEERWDNINSAGQKGFRGLNRTLEQIFEHHVPERAYAKVYAYKGPI